MEKYNTDILNLFEIILNLDEKRQRKLLSIAKTLFLREKRRDDRKTCQIPVYYATEDQVYTGYIKNISRTGLFIETKKNLPIGDEILMTFRLQGLNKPIKIKGQIAHTNKSGVGIKFKNTNSKLMKAIGILVDRMNVSNSVT